eukprot:jgi/Mesvir1/7937/Mv11858-RA.1
MNPGGDSRPRAYLYVEQAQSMMGDSAARVAFIRGKIKELVDADPDRFSDNVYYALLTLQAMLGPVVHGRRTAAEWLLAEVAEYLSGGAFVLAAAKVYGDPPKCIARLRFLLGVLQVRQSALARDDYSAALGQLQQMLGYWETLYTQLHGPRQRHVNGSNNRNYNQHSNSSNSNSSNSHGQGGAPSNQNNNGQGGAMPPTQVRVPPQTGAATPSRLPAPTPAGALSQAGTAGSNNAEVPAQAVAARMAPNQVSTQVQGKAVAVPSSTGPVTVPSPSSGVGEKAPEQQAPAAVRVAPTTGTRAPVAPQGEATAASSVPPQGGPVGAPAQTWVAVQGGQAEMAPSRTASAANTVSSPISVQVVPSTSSVQAPVPSPAATAARGPLSAPATLFTPQATVPMLATGPLLRLCKVTPSQAPVVPYAGAVAGTTPLQVTGTVPRAVPVPGSAWAVPATVTVTAPAQLPVWAVPATAVTPADVSSRPSTASQGLGSPSLRAVATVAPVVAPVQAAVAPASAGSIRAVPVTVPVPVPAPVPVAVPVPVAMPVPVPLSLPSALPVSAPVLAPVPGHAWVVPVGMSARPVNATPIANLNNQPLHNPPNTVPVVVPVQPGRVAPWVQVTAATAPAQAVPMVAGQAPWTPVASMTGQPPWGQVAPSVAGQQPLGQGAVMASPAMGGKEVEEVEMMTTVPTREQVEAARAITPRAARTQAVVAVPAARVTRASERRGMKRKGESGMASEGARISQGSVGVGVRAVPATATTAQAAVATGPAPMATPTQGVVEALVHGAATPHAVVAVSAVQMAAPAQGGLSGQVAPTASPGRVRIANERAGTVNGRVTAVVVRAVPASAPAAQAPATQATVAEPAKAVATVAGAPVKVMAVVGAAEAPAKAVGVGVSPGAPAAGAAQSAATAQGGLAELSGPTVAQAAPTVAQAATTTSKEAVAAGPVQASVSRPAGVVARAVASQADAVAVQASASPVPGQAGVVAVQALGPYAPGQAGAGAPADRVAQTAAPERRDAASLRDGLPSQSLAEPPRKAEPAPAQGAVGAQGAVATPAQARVAAQGVVATEVSTHASASPVPPQAVAAVQAAQPVATVPAGAGGRAGQTQPTAVATLAAEPTMMTQGPVAVQGARTAAMAPVGAGGQLEGGQEATDGVPAPVPDAGTTPSLPVIVDGETFSKASAFSDAAIKFSGSAEERVARIERYMAVLERHRDAFVNGYKYAVSDLKGLLQFWKDKCKGSKESRAKQRVPDRGGGGMPATPSGRQGMAALQPAVRSPSQGVAGASQALVPPQSRAATGVGVGVGVGVGMGMGMGVQPLLPTATTQGGVAAVQALGPMAPGRAGVVARAAPMGAQTQATGTTTGTHAPPPMPSTTPVGMQAPAQRPTRAQARGAVAVQAPQTAAAGQGGAQAPQMAAAVSAGAQAEVGARAVADVTVVDVSGFEAASDFADAATTGAANVWERLARIAYLMDALKNEAHKFSHATVEAAERRLTMTLKNWQRKWAKLPEPHRQRLQAGRTATPAGALVSQAGNAAAPALRGSVAPVHGVNVAPVQGVNVAYQSSVAAWASTQGGIRREGDMLPGRGGILAARHGGPTGAARQGEKTRGNRVAKIRGRARVPTAGCVTLATAQRRMAALQGGMGGMSVGGLITAQGGWPRPGWHQ